MGPGSAVEVVAQDPSYLTVLDCTTVVLTLSGNDVFWVTLVSAVTVDC